ncbi:MAG: polysaccharide biosynthesis/export family protein [Bacteroidia bacterium]|nr:polysaccharide biosynthesis/export family protein [Bacteroidia bacterium]
MVNHKNYCFFIIAILLAVFTNCTSKKKLVYFNDTKSEIASGTNTNYSPTLKSDDLLSVIVMGIEAEAVKPFNLPTNLISGNNIGGYTQGAPTPPGYLIDGDGNIDLPVIGKVKIAGLTRVAAAELIKEKLKAYINEPIVNIRILNYKVTVLGEVRNPGTFTIPNERITLPEALGIAGDLLITGVRKNVLVIRDIDGKKTETRVDLTSKALFSSPVYYLHQNDVIYIEPNRAKINSSVVNASNVGIVISVISLLTTIAVLLSR